MDVIYGSFQLTNQPTQGKYSSLGVRAAIAAGSLPATRPLDLASHYLQELRTAEARSRQMQRRGGGGGARSSQAAAKSANSTTGMVKKMSPRLRELASVAASRNLGATNF